MQIVPDADKFIFDDGLLHRKVKEGIRSPWMNKDRHLPYESLANALESRYEFTPIHCSISKSQIWRQHSYQEHENNETRSEIECCGMCRGQNNIGCAITEFIVDEIHMHDHD